ncbi:MULTISPECIES: hypothetical protein [Sphingomonas]|uniref:TonB C-terminal domain-containing protein n=1 Tax=Sphingomonas adhaesiva TaxID=28212 RepID=A0A2A4I9R2_9SPHN|nr:MULTISPECIES: hypothetical protein [Sphingomonas]PCG15331.1 hypothetical protein COA07_07380 [Sphingomonas adhaesiva]PZU77546.1 MAG: hypothetical protein DI530_12690 [Sphingomonas sp.]
MFGIVISATLLSLPQAAATSGASPAKWVLHADQARCVLERQDASVRFAVDTTPGSDTFALVVAGPGLRHSDRLMRVTIAGTDAAAEVRGLAQIRLARDGTVIARIAGLPPKLLDGLHGAGPLTLRIDGSDPVVLSLPGVARAVTALRGCVADQLIEWGADPAQFAPGGQPPVALRDRDDWLANRDLLAIMGLSPAPVLDATFRVAVSATGVAAECQPQSDDIPATVVAAVCSRIAGKTLVTPAHDHQGRPVRGVVTFRIQLSRQAS